MVDGNAPAFWKNSFRSLKYAVIVPVLAILALTPSTSDMPPPGDDCRIV